MSRARKQLLGYAAGLTFAVGVVGGIVASMTVFVPIEPSLSGIGARVGSAIVKWLVLALAVLYAAIPIGVAIVRAKENGQRLYHGIIATVAILGPLVAFIAVLYTLDYMNIGVGSLLLLGILYALVAFFVGIGATAYWILSNRETVRPAWPVALNLALVVLFAIGFVGASPIATDFADEETERYSTTGPNLLVQFETQTTEGNETMLNITHGGGDSVEAEHLYIRGKGFAPAESANQTAPGPWLGERSDNGVVGFGDSTYVGINDDCRIRLIYSRGEVATTLGIHDCTDS